jgi:hypothetical protein
MPINASSLFDFIEARSSFVIERHEIRSAVFGDLRRSLRLMITSFHESGEGEAKEIADRLRAVLSEWLTVPVQFDNAVLFVLEEMGGPSAVESRWGHDIRGHYEDACKAAQKLMDLENPLRATLANLLKELQASRQSFRIFCHKRSCEHFESLSESYAIEALQMDAFIHSVLRYRETEIFDVLLKVGPLRSRGWSATPDAVLTAPRYHTLIQVVWSGCGDEQGFGYDPVSAHTPESNCAPGQNATTDIHNRILQLNWEVRETRARDNIVGRCSDISDVNDLQVFTELAQRDDLHHATLVQVDDIHGILYPPLSRVLSFDGDPQTVDFRLPGETLQEGMFLILPVVDDLSLAELQAEPGDFSRTWKERLQTEFRCDPEGLMRHLRDGGLRLLGLRSCIERWCIPATTVIPAPLQMRHFEILISVLGADFDAGTHDDRHRPPWWRYAWNEVRRSRGEAIQMGFQEQHVLEEQMVAAVNSLDAEIRDNLHRSAFELLMPVNQSHEIRGALRFYKVMAIEEGFRVPPGELKMLCDLDRIDQWRV